MNAKMRTAVMGAAAALLAVSLFDAALGHTSVAGSNPADGSEVEALPGTVSVRFGEPALPLQPLAATDATLEVIDACGAPVHSGESSFDPVTSEVSIATAPSERAGRYELHWFATAADGAAQAGAIDFTVTGGKPCVKTVREDATDDVDLGVDISGVVTKHSARAAQVTVTTAGFDPETLASDSASELALQIDTDGDESPDQIGRFVWTAGKYSLELATADAEEGEIEHRLRVRSVKDSLTVKIPHGLFDEERYIEVYAESLTDSDDCAEKVCIDRAPDLGWLRLD